MKKIDGNPLTVDFEELQGRIHKLLYNALQNNPVFFGLIPYKMVKTMVSVVDLKSHATPLTAWLQTIGISELSKDPVLQGQGLRSGKPSNFYYIFLFMPFVSSTSE